MISGPSSYLPTLDAFLAHWAAVNADPLSASGMLTRDGSARADLVTVKSNLGAATQEVENQLNGKEIGRARVENAKKALLLRSQELGRRLRGILPMDSPYLKAMPDLPPVSAAQEYFLKPMRDLVNVWNRLREDDVEFQLAGAYVVANFENDLSVLTELFTILGQVELDLKLAREKRNVLQVAAMKILSAYRPAVEGLFAPASPLVVTIPLIYPPAGHTPDPVTVTVSYDATTQEAVIEFSESAEATLEEYEVRGVPGPEYLEEDAITLGKIAAGGARIYHTSYALTEPGSELSLKVYVILKTGNEAGSKAVTVMRA